MQTHRLAGAALTSALAAALTLAAGAAAAAEATVYGGIDAGLYMTDTKHGNPNLQMHGTDISTVWGIRTKEDLGNGTYVRVSLEGGFDGSSGAVANDARAGTFFSRDALLIVGNERMGEVAFGRTGGLLGSTGTYGQWAANAMNPIYSNNPDGGLPGAFQSSPIVDNAVTFRTAPFLGGLRVVGQYSNAADQAATPESDGFSKVQHVYALGASWTGEKTTALALVQVIDYPNKTMAATPSDAKATVNFFAGASAYVWGDLRVHVAYQHLEHARGVLGTPNVISGADMGFAAATSREGFTADSFSVGANHPLLGGRIHGSVKMVRASWEGPNAANLADDGERWVGAVRYSYPLSKRTNLYAVGTYAYGNGMFRNTEKAENVASRSTVAMGMTHKF